MGGKTGNSGGPSVSSSSANQIASAAALISLRQADDLLTLYARNKGEASREEIMYRVYDENWTQLVFAVVNDSKTSLAVLRFLSKVFEKIVDFVISDPALPARDALKSVLTSQKMAFDKFLSELSSGEILFYGASLWLAYCKLFVTVFGTKMPSREWNEFFAPMESWFKISDREAVVICLQVWTSFISFAAPKLSTGALREKLLGTFSKPLRSHAVMNKLSTPAPIISAYIALISAFRSSVDERFEELIICFLRFITGKPVIALEDVNVIEDEIAKPINENNLRLILEGSSSDFMDYLTDPRPHRVFNSDALKHVFPLICSVLGVQESIQGVPVCANVPALMMKYGVLLTQAVRFAGHVSACETDANSICSCFAALGHRIEGIEDVEGRRRESRFLFIQVRAWIAESTEKAEDIECAICQLFRGRDLFVHANAVREWPAIDLLRALLEKSSTKLRQARTKTLYFTCFRKFVELIPGTICGGREPDTIVLERLKEICGLIKERINRFDVHSLLKTWSNLAEILTVFVKKTDDINEGNLLKPNFSTTFGLLKLLFTIANHANEDPNADTLAECSSAFCRLFAEVQTTVRHEVDCNAETVLCDVFGSTTQLETDCCTHLFTHALLAVVDIYPFESLTKKEVFSGSTGEFYTLGELTTFVNAIQLVGRKVINTVNSDKAQKLPRSTSKDFLTLLVICQKLFAAVEEPSVIRTLFLAVCDLLDHMLAKIYSDDSRLKEVIQESLAAFTSIVESVQSKIPGPFDDSFLSECAPLFTRKVLLPLVKKRLISVPGFSKSNDVSGDVLSSGEDTSFTVSPSNTTLSSSRPRRSRKSVKLDIGDSEMGNSSHASPHVAATTSSQTGKRRYKAKSNVNEETDTPTAKVAKKEPPAVEESGAKSERANSKGMATIPIKTPKVEEITPSRQAATPRTKRRMYVGLLDEDSVDYVPIVSSESAKKMKLTDRQREMFSEKRERMPFLDEDSQNSAVIAHLPSEFDVESSQSVSSQPTKPADSTSCAVLGDERIEGERKDPLIQVEPTLVSPIAEIKEEQVAGASSAILRRKPKLKLDFNQVGSEDGGPYGSESKSSQHEKSSPIEEVKELSDIQAGNSSADEVSSSEESTAPSIENVMDENVEIRESLGSRRSRKKGTPTKYVDQKKRETNKSTEKGQKMILTPTSKRSRHSCKASIKGLLEGCGDSQTVPPPTQRSNVQPEDCVEPQAVPPSTQEASAQLPEDCAIQPPAQEATVPQSDEALVLREIDEVLNVKELADPSLDESLEEKDEDHGVKKTPEKQNMGTEKIASTPTPAFVQRIASTPGILKKVDSPSTAERKLRRVHFGGDTENKERDAITDDAVKAIASDDLIPVSPKGIVKRATPRRPFFHLQTTAEQVTKVAALPNESVAASPVKSEADAATCADDEPIFPRLADCQESIGRIVGRLLPISSTNGAIAARKSLEAQGIVRICDLASKSRREVSLLNIKKPRIETAFRTLSQFARDHLKSETSPVTGRITQQDLLIESVEILEEVVLESPDENVADASITVAISEIDEVELEAAESDNVDAAELEAVRNNGVNSVECSPNAPEKPMGKEDIVEVEAAEIGKVAAPVASEMKRLLDAVRETYRHVEAEMDVEESSADLTKLRRVSAKAARALLDLASWCDEATS